MRKKCPSDVTREQFEKILPLLESVRKKTHPRRLDLYDVFCGVLSVLKSGCPWNMLPSEFGNHKTVHEYFMRWNEEKKIGRQKQPGILEEILKKYVGEVRLSNGRSAFTSMGISLTLKVSKTLIRRGKKGMTRGNQETYRCGFERGLPHAMSVTTANVTDRDGALQMTKRHKKDLSEIEKLLVDGGYSGEKFAKEIKKILKAKTEVVKRNEVHTFKVLPKRRVVERSFAWLEKCRRLWKNCERKLSTSRQMIILAFIVDGEGLREGY